ncbi:MAG: MarR family transcriptional regulator [Mariniphaga sp.]|nr:MarR family transcriptional regulator [Mariniphaga sp.]MDD4225880.1 MarR family transcriptional regulator [Mariniphaga sp.]MDD4425559.1 MarR family transcriptional regulator [Mariniphaga sp.]
MIGRIDTMEILIQIRKIVRSINIESKKIEKEYGVSIPQVLCLHYLRDSKNFQAGQGEIRRFLNLNPSTTSGIINRLEAKGLIARLPKSGDKRVVTIALTSKGDQLMEGMPALLHEQLSEKLNKLDDLTTSRVQESLELLVNLLGISQLEAFDLHAEEPRSISR